MSLAKVWQRAQGLDPEACKDQKMAVSPLVVTFLAQIVMAVVMFQLLGNLGVFGWMAGAIAGLAIGVGFMFTTILVNNMFQQKAWMLTAIDGIHWVIVAAIQGAVIGAML